MEPTGFKSAMFGFKKADVLQFIADSNREYQQQLEEEHSSRPKQCTSSWSRPSRSWRLCANNWCASSSGPIKWTG